MVVYIILIIALEHIYHWIAQGQLHSRGNHKIIKIYPIFLNLEINVCLFSGVMNL